MPCVAMPRFAIWAVAIILLSTAGDIGAADRIIGANAPQGGALLLKRIAFDAPATIVGIRFTSNDRSTVFPRVLVIADGCQTAQDLQVLSEARDVAAAGAHRVSAPVPRVFVEPGESVYIGVELPPHNGALAERVGAGVIATQRDVPTNSFLVTPDAALGVMDVEYEMEAILASPADRSGKASAPNPATLDLSVETVAQGRSIRLTVSLPSPASMRLDVYDVRGRLVRRVFEGPLQAGLSHHVWDRGDAVGVRVASGIYFVKATSERETVTRRVVVAE